MRSWTASTTVAVMLRPRRASHPVSPGGTAFLSRMLISWASGSPLSTFAGSVPRDTVKVLVPFSLLSAVFTSAVPAVSPAAMVTALTAV